MNPWYPTVAERAAHRCEYCHAPEAAFNFPFEVEHITPRIRDGADTDDNLALSCRSCNLRKSTHVDALDPETKTTVALFHPRSDDWDTHFSIDTDTADVIGLTESGRATITCLDINSASQCAARKLWMRLGLFP